MIRTLNIILIGGMMAGAGFVYHLKYEAERATSDVGRLHRKIQQEREQIATLRAEWSLLNQPRRLQEMAERYHTYLELEPLDPAQVGTIDEIPLRKSDPEAAPAATGPLGKGFAGVKPVEITGSIRKTGDRLPAKTDKPEPKGLDPRPGDPLTTILR